MWVTSSLKTIQTPTIVALGNFDGIHQGHWRVIEPILPIASTERESLHWSSAKNLKRLSRGSAADHSIHSLSGLNGDPHATVVTFHPHPQEFFTGDRRRLLTPLNEKIGYLQAMGVEQLVLLPFDQALADLTPKEFVETILVQRLQVRQISVGQDFCFGQRRSGTTADLQAIAANHGVTVQVIALRTDQGERISSSAIRQALQEGDLSRANRLLGRPYTLVGQVVQGQQLGRTLGFPTANLQLPPEKFLPSQGVYYVQVCCPDVGDRLLPGVMNLGYRPTVDGVKQTVEVHLLDWSGDLYGQTLVVSLEKFLRPEQKFSSLDALKAQIQLDCNIARSLVVL